MNKKKVHPQLCTYVMMTHFVGNSEPYNIRFKKFWLQFLSEEKVHKNIEKTRKSLKFRTSFQSYSFDFWPRLMIGTSLFVGNLKLYNICFKKFQLPSLPDEKIYEIIGKTQKLSIFPAWFQSYSFYFWARLLIYIWFCREFEALQLLFQPPHS